jgi:dihydropyrimidine dehydrogenase (NAD+) subunit PreT
MSPVAPARRHADDLAADFAERLAPLTTDQAVVEASRCLYCFDAPCMVACPTSIDIPGFIQRISTGDRLGAANRIFEQNVLGASCARVCATEELCEEACVLDRAHEKPIEIGRLQRYATDLVVDGGLSIPYTPGPDTGKHVAIIGGGPAGLAAAAGLRVHGHAVTIFERQPQLGGLATYGIIPLREPTEIALWEAEQILALGVTANCGVEVGVDVDPQTLLNDFDAVFLAIGSGRNVADIGLHGADIPGVDDALEFIESIRTTPPEQVPVGEHVVVVGAGNTAMDACTIAVRLGAKTVTCVYRRTEAEMTGYPNEYDHCMREGVRFKWLTQPLRAVASEDGHVSGLVCVDVTLGAPGADGKAVTILGIEEQVIECDHVLLATGQNRETSVPVALGLALDGARPRTNSDGFSTSHASVFAGGDAVLSGKELSVVDAVAQGRDAAESIHAFLSGGSQ